MMSSSAISIRFLLKFAGSYGFARVVDWLLVIFLKKFAGAYGFKDVEISDV